MNHSLREMGETEVRGQLQLSVPLKSSGLGPGRGGVGHRADKTKQAGRLLCSKHGN